MSFRFKRLGPGALPSRHQSSLGCGHILPALQARPAATQMFVEFGLTLVTSCNNIGATDFILLGVVASRSDVLLWLCCLD